MIRNYLLTAWRNLQKNKLNAFINVTGLSVAFTCCILLFLMVRFEFSYDQFHANKTSLFEVYSIDHASAGDELSESMSFAAVPAFKAECPSVLKASTFCNEGSGIRYNGKELTQKVNLVDNDFFSMFTFPVAAGNTVAPLGSLNDVVLTQYVATALFGKEDPIGKGVEVKVNGTWKALTVSSILKDFPDNSTLAFGILARTEIAPDFSDNKDNWNNQSHAVYVQLAANATQAKAEAELKRLIERHHLYDPEQAKKNGSHKDERGEYYSYRLEKLTDLHFAESLTPRMAINKNYLYTLILIAVIVMVIACFNFINLNVARAFTRAKEVGIRKTIGAGKRQIYFQLWAESLLLFGAALLLSIGLASLTLAPFNSLFTEKLKLSVLLQPSVLLIALGMTIVVSFLAGGYPAWLVARFNAVEVLKGKVSVRRSSALRSGLIVFQFILASALICSTIVIYRQFEHLRTAPLGFTQESVISIPIKNAENSARIIDELRQRLANQPQVEAVTGSTVNIGIGEDHGQSHWGIGFSYQDKQIMTTALFVNYDFLKVLGMKTIAGRDFSREFASDTSTKSNNVIVTESMAKQFGVKDAVGLSFYTDSAKPKWTIIGVIPDFHLYSMHERLSPTTLFMQKGDRALGYILVKVKTTNPTAAMDLVTSNYHQLEPDNTVRASYITENTQRWYDKEQRLSDIFFSAAFIAILLSCLGLFAIVSLMMVQRRKEIGVRKVLGASIPSITGLLSKDFVRLVVIAFVIASPIAGYFLEHWLRNFEYRTTLAWWIFPLAGVATLMIALLTVSIQTVRAALANPVKSLRSE